MFFRDACSLMVLSPTLPTTTHLVAHLLREVESGVRHALEPPGVKAAKGEGGHTASVKAVLSWLGIDEGHKAAGTWLALADRDGSEGFARRAHRSGLDAPRLLDGDFIRYFADAEELFDMVMDRCEKRYHLVVGYLDALAATASPGEKDVEKFRARPQTLAMARRFLHAAGPQWIKPLSADSYFETPPEVVPDAEGRITLFDWPASDYLARMATAEPVLAVDAALTIPKTDNSRVNYDLVRIALAVPADQALRLASVIQQSLTSMYGVLIPEQVGALAAHLADGGHVDPALSLLTALLATLPGPPGAHGTWEIAEIARRDLPALVSAAGQGVLAIFCARLDTYLKEEQSWTREETGADYSTTWWPDLQHPAPHAEIDSAAALASGVLAACSQLLEADPSTAPVVVAELKTHRWDIYRRMRLHLLTRFPETAANLLAEQLLDPQNLHDSAVEREYLRLAKARCAELSGPDRQRAVGLIQRGPDLEEWSANLARWDSAPSPTQLAQHSDLWKRDRLAAFEQVLTATARASYSALHAQYGPAQEPPVLPDGAVWGARAPHSAAELSAMPTDEMIALLRNWKPGADTFLGPDRSTMAGVLKEVITTNRAQWSADARAFRGVEPVYITAVLESLVQDRDEAARLDWESILDLCEHVNEHAVRETDTVVPWTARHWRDARQDVFRLIALGLDKRAISESDLDRVWAMITSGSGDPDPTSEREHDEERPLLTAFDAVRPQAVGCTIAYGLMRREHPEELAEVLQLLADHLDPDVDLSPAVRTVYGANLPQLITIAPDWVRTHLTDLLPTGDRNQTLREATWDAFLERATLSDKVLETLRDQYTVAVERIDADSTNSREQARTLRLGVHLLGYYWNGALDLDTSDSMLRTYYRKASPEICQQLADALSRGLRNTSAPDPNLIARLTAIWDFRENSVGLGADSAELAEFGHWFASGFFDETWAFGRLLRAINAAQRIEAIDNVLERLAMLADTHTLQCLNVLSAWVATRPKNLYMVHRRETDIRTILDAGRHGDDAEQEAAESVLGQFASLEIDLRETT